MSRPLENKLPEYASVLQNDPISNNPNVVEPEQAQKNTGWLYQQQPPMNFMNWIHRVGYKWLEYFDQEINQFAPQENEIPDLGITINEGRVQLNGEVIIVASQQTTPVTAPVTDPRIDLYTINKSDGLYNVYSGAESPTPATPVVPDGEVPVCSVLLTPSTTEITNDIIADIRTANMPTPAQGRTYQNGIEISNNSANPDTHLDFSAGEVDDTTATLRIISSSTITKTTAAWSAGNLGGAFPAGAPLANDTWYSAWVLCKADGKTVEFGLDSVLLTTPTNLLTDANTGLPPGEQFVYFRRRGYRYVNSSGEFAIILQQCNKCLFANKYDYKTVASVSNVIQQINVIVPPVSEIACSFRHSVESQATNLNMRSIITTIDHPITPSTVQYTLKYDRGGSGIDIDHSSSAMLFAKNGQIAIESDSNSGSITMSITNDFWEDERIN